MSSIKTFLENEIEVIEAKFGVLTIELKNTIIPVGITIGNSIEKILQNSIVDFVLEQYVSVDLITEVEVDLKKAIAALTTVETIINLPTASAQLIAFIQYLQTLTADSKNAFVVKLIQLLVKFIDGSKLPGSIYDSLVQAAVTNQKLLAA